MSHTHAQPPAFLLSSLLTEDSAWVQNLLDDLRSTRTLVVVVNTPAGITAPLRRATVLASLAGIRHLALCIGLLDPPFAAQSRFRQIQAEFESTVSALGFEAYAVFPVRLQTNGELSDMHFVWHQGETLEAWLNARAGDPVASLKPAFVVECVEGSAEASRNYVGYLAQGAFRLHQRVREVHSGQTATITRIDASDESAVELHLDTGMAADRGAIFCAADQPLEITDQFEASVIWLGVEQGLAGRRYDLVLAGQNSSASVTNIKHRLNVSTLAHESARTLHPNDIAVCTLALDRALVYDTYALSPALGSFTLFDRYSKATVAVGMVRHSLRRAQNVHRQTLNIARQDREALNGHPGRVIWLTGLSGSGKSTLANALTTVLHQRGMRTYLLDGDNVRQGLNKDLGFTDADRTENIRRVAEVAKLMMDAGLIVLTAFISPFRQEREMARNLIGAQDFVEIFIDTPLAICEERDPKGLYKKARAGQLPNMTGIDSPYEAPEAPHLRLDMGVLSLDEAVERALHIVPKTGAQTRTS